MTGSGPKTVRIIGIADLLGVTKQRAHQIAEEKGCPAPLRFPRTPAAESGADLVKHLKEAHGVEEVPASASG
jgi:hypothetical protein